jgi:hypothetical protein
MGGNEFLSYFPRLLWKLDQIQQENCTSCCGGAFASCRTIRAGKAVFLLWAKCHHVYPWTVQHSDSKERLREVCAPLAPLYAFSYTLHIVDRITFTLHLVVQSTWWQFRCAVSPLGALGRMHWRLGSLHVLQTRKNVGYRVDPVMLTELVEMEGGIADGDLPASGVRDVHIGAL